ncbi:DNA-binding SARP family transcriptional activator [Streptomyces sp. SAI-117]|uniref:AfsR/SARP family transcriptional regulator n=1 Tax=unclassified Streptomyces TaxID=2593676 RepID=UPI002476B1ED|nr:MULTISPECIES: AfsR/SARP family transcriptional regulator [unclassified Streptomyces]MDH6553534.1 DNA-binding SARP family transcriptional activator [Streptomyces sp. SAI-041]MDH6572616.1 DNA-binding SARP family transcriptional activator [Streptomyces sp. SAI-117]MDH6582424.1 DNA-binding SARP family transcriptional activator [Streptomyces sp. SAI-133]
MNACTLRCVHVVEFGVLGSVSAWDGSGEPISLKGPRHRAVLARLLVARRRVVPVPRLVEDLWGQDPPADAVGTVRTFVAGLRRALEPERPRRAPARLLVTEGPGYALRADPAHVDAWRFEHAVAEAADLPPAQAVPRLTGALELWRGPAYADFAEEAWVRAERSRLAGLRLTAVERRAEAQLALGAAADAAADLDAHVAEHPWREDGWQLLALALYRCGRQADALSVLRRARQLLREHLGVEPGPRLHRTEQDILRHADHLAPGATDTAAQVWAEASASYASMVPLRAGTRLESTVVLMRDLAVTGGGGLEAARRHRAAAVAAAEQLGDPELTARVIGVYDVPAVWTRSDDPAQAERLVAAAERTLRLLPAGAHEAARARLLATVAVESRGTLPTGTRALQAAHQAVAGARRLDDANLLVFALNGLFMQSFERAGLAARRDGIGAEITELAARHGLFTYEVLGRLIRLQARCAAADFTAADRHAAAADALAERHRLPLVTVFTTWYRALRTAVTEPAHRGESAYREAARSLEGAGMPGLERGLLPLALLCLRLHHGLPLTADPHTDWGPYEPWVRPLLLLAEGRDQDAVGLLAEVPSPPGDLLYEALWCLLARAAIQVGDRALMRRALSALEPARGELAGAASGLLTAGPVADHLDALTAAFTVHAS